jgi:(p)ppGpp synthase/HD superfamily hydrolase
MVPTENRKTFFRRIANTFNQKEDVFAIRLAYMLAKYAHRYQKRLEERPDGEKQRYFEHLRRTAIILIDEVGICDRMLVVAALLHDTLEDTDEVDFDLIAHYFGKSTAGVVLNLSKTPPEGYVERLARAEWCVLVVKACDRLDNLRSLSCPGVTQDFMAKQVRETREKYLPIFDLMVSQSPVQWIESSRRMRDRIAAEVERLEQLLAVPPVLVPEP